MDTLQSLTTWLYDADGSPFAALDARMQFIVLGLFAAILSYLLLIFRPAPPLGEVSGPQIDEDGRGGTPHWSVRTIADRAMRLALPVLKAVLLIAATLLVGGAALNHPRWGGIEASGVIFAAFAGVIVWIVAARFWAMGRKALLTVIDSDDGTVRLNYWWASEIGLQESARLRLGGRLGQGEAGVFWLNPGQRRSEIALPEGLKERLGVEDGAQRIFTIASTAGGAGAWPLLLALPLAYGVMNGSLDRGAPVAVADGASCAIKVVEKEKVVEKVVEKTVPKVVDREICTVYFDLDKSALNAPAKRALADVDGKSREPGVRIGVVGHTDTTGSDPYNKALSEARAVTAARTLEAHGIAVDEVEGRGESDLAVPTPDQTLEARNRRTVITIDPPAFNADTPTQ